VAKQVAEEAALRQAERFAHVGIDALGNLLDIGHANADEIVVAAQCGGDRVGRVGHAGQTGNEQDGH
jgi:hypothetical protein